jgi:arylsulfatase A-like enzyme
MTRPNIIFIVADDLGYADLGCYGGRDAAFGPVSPVLDGLAANGLKLTQGYANSPVCSPTRFGMITARYQYRLRGAAEEPINSKSRGSTTLGLPTDHPTLPSLLKASGYQTALIGKWHLGYPPTFGPLRSGYDEFFGPMSGGVDYFTHCDSTGRHDLWFGEEDKQEEGYLTDILSKRAVDYVDRMAALQKAEDGKDAPFFLSLHYTAPHWPWETRDDAEKAPLVKDNLFDLAGGNIHVYRRMIHHMDEGIGWIMAALHKPWIAHWPAVIGKGGESTQLCMTMDWSATMLDAAGVAADPAYPLDGVSLMPVLKDAKQSFRRPLHWRMNHRGQEALRDGDWKYLKVDGNEYLFNIPADERERANLAKKEPERLAAMRADWAQWNATMPAIPEDATVSLGYSVKDMPQR